MKPIQQHEGRAMFGYVTCLAVLLGAILAGPVNAEIAIPSASDWTDHGIIAPRGTTENSDWDWRMNGALNPGAMVKFNGKYFVYYIGARTDRSSDGGPAYRKLGVATCDVNDDCTNSANWSKYANNPIVSHEIPSGCDEAGVFSAAVLVENNEVVLYFGGMEERPGCTGSVDIDGVVVTSADGFNFSPPQDAFRWSDVPHSNDEVEPVEAIKINGTYYIYYISADWDLYVTTGTNRLDTKYNAKKILDVSPRVNEVSVVSLGGDSFAVFVLEREYPENLFNLDIRKTTSSDPTSLSSRVDYYGESTPGWGDMAEAIVYLDEQAETWFMVYNDHPEFGSIRLKSAPMSGDSGGEVDSTPPRAPSGLTVP